MSEHKLKSFDEFISIPVPVLAVFHADWCSACRVISPLIDEIARQRGDIVVKR